MIVGVMLMAATLIVAGLDWRTSRCIRITRDQVESRDAIFGGLFGADAMAHSAIEELRVERGGLTIEGDAASMRVGVGLSRSALHWLRGYVLSAISTA